MSVLPLIHKTEDVFVKLLQRQVGVWRRIFAPWGKKKVIPEKHFSYCFQKLKTCVQQGEEKRVNVMTLPLSLLFCEGQWGQWQPVLTLIFMHIITLRSHQSYLSKSGTNLQRVISYAWLSLLNILHLHALVIYGISRVGNKAGDWQG